MARVGFVDCQSMRRFACPLLIVASSACVLPSIVAADPAPADVSSNSIRSEWTVPKLVDAIRTAEGQFAELETVVKKKRLRPDLAIPIKARRGKVTTSGGIQEEVTTRSVRHGEQFYAKTVLSRKGSTLRTVSVERLVAFDGQKTRTIEVGSAVNIHDGKTILVRSLPPHSWPQALDVPLSDFLAGANADKETRQPPVDSLLGDNLQSPMSATEPRIVGKESLKGIACLKLEFEEADPRSGEPKVHNLWLAKERHFIPVKEQVFKSAESAQLPMSEARVEDWLEVKKKVWLPKRIVRVTYEDHQAKNGKERRKESRRETLLLEKASLDINYPPEFFRELNPPAGLPAFTIKVGRLADSFPHSDESGGNEEKLQKIKDQLRDEENRYNHLSIDATELRTTNPLVLGNDKTRTTKMHSVLYDDRALTDARHETWHFSGSLRPMLWTEAFDGRAYRAYGRHPPPQKGGYAWISTLNFFVKPYTLLPVMLRPHSALLPIDGSSYRRLTDVIWSQPGTVPRILEKEVEYLGEASAGLLSCYVLAVRPAHARQPGFKSLLWLAKERNLIPVRFEEYRPGETLPVRLEIVEKFSEPSPGVWYPAHKTRYIFRQQIAPAVREGYLFVDQCWDYTVNAVSLDPLVSDVTFSQIVVDEGIDVQYFDKHGKLFNKITQTSDSVPEMPAGK
jgi:hypothetical protein